MIGATVLFALANAIAKWQVAIYPVGEVMFFRSFFSLVVCAAFILPFTGVAVFATRRPRDHLARGLSQSISQTFTVIAFRLMPLAGAIAINFSAPLFSALLSIVCLKERAGAARWIALLAGFFGVLIVTNPGADSLTLGALFALGNAVMYGSVTVAVRGMTKTESANTLLMWQMLTIAVCPLLPAAVRLPLADRRRRRHLRPQRRRQGGRAISLDPGAAVRAATAVSPFYYLMLVWALVIGYVVWGDVPTIGLIVGSGIVVASGLFLLWHEAQRRPQAEPAPAMPAAKRPPATGAPVSALRMTDVWSWGSGRQCLGHRPLGDDIGELLDRNGGAEQVALRFVAAECREKFLLAGGFDAFCRGGHAQRRAMLTTACTMTTCSVPPSRSETKLRSTLILSKGKLRR